MQTSRRYIKAAWKGGLFLVRRPARRNAASNRNQPVLHGTSRAGDGKPLAPGSQRALPQCLRLAPPEIRLSDMKSAICVSICRFYAYFDMKRGIIMAIFNKPPILDRAVPSATAEN